MRRGSGFESSLLRLFLWPITALFTEPHEKGEAATRGTGLRLEAPLLGSSRLEVAKRCTQGPRSGASSGG